MLILYFIKFRFRVKRENKFILVGLSILLIISMLNLIVSDIPPLQYFRGLFDYLHVFVFMILVSCTMSLDDYDTIGNCIIGIVAIDVVFVVYQYFVLGLVQDQLGGLFGNSAGCNGIQNTFCIIGLIILLSKYLHGKTSIKKLIVYCLATVCIAGLAELTAYFFEVFILIATAFIVNRNKIDVKTILKYLAISIAGIIGVIVGFKILVMIFPTKARFLDFRNVLEYIGASDSGTGVYEISRVKAISQISNLFLHSAYTKLFGLGLGYTTEGGAFFSQYSNLQYQWFSTAVTMLESGYLGVIIRALILVYIFFSTGKKSRNTNDSTLKQWYMVTQLTVVYTAIIFFYNNTLENKYDSYLLGFYLATYGLNSLKINVKNINIDRNIKISN